ncbi:heme oxygenase-like protein [Aspergillus steynii IBT 23096]|uniref:Heme oxygenase-like protein n=1 Tax=Aspergillus steynii IBT 23096 TaxID=1392250 RepID=A0A2I2GIW3_9EURO|nr:heme oxygenase-like protein [Aspergillus steynii IBT 23096]PLB52808.1 heme oxygenase-like protein [Aspergillus steynii IBT 23096]
MTQLTQHLPTTTPQSLRRATTHPFLQRAGEGTLPKPLLAQWLSQDRLYAQSYIRFIGLLLSKIRIPSATPAPGTPPQQSLEDRTAAILIDALVNIQRELGFFEATAAEYGLDLNARADTAEEGPGSDFGFGPNAITHAYIDLFLSAGSAGTSLLEGLVVLWATETCYLRAWRFAASFLGSGQGERQDTDGGALREKFIPNWSSGEFEGFVDGIGQVVDEMAGGYAGGDKQELLGRCERWWRQVVWLEERFWPEV